MASFDEFIRKALTHESEPMDHKRHPSDETLLKGIAGELGPEERSRLAAHLITCPECLARWQGLATRLDEELTALEAEARVPTLAEFVEKRNQARLSARVRSWLRSFSFVLQKRPAVAMAVSGVAAAMLTLAIAVPLLWGPAMSTSHKLASLTQEVKALREELASFPPGTIPSTIPGKIPEPGEVEEWASQAREVKNPWQRAIFVASILDSHGITLPQGFDWTRLSTYTVRPGDTWQGISTELFGSPALWTIIYLLNADKGLPADSPPPGQRILLPTPLK